MPPVLSCVGKIPHGSSSDPHLQHSYQPRVSRAVHSSPVSYYHISPAPPSVCPALKLSQHTPWSADQSASPHHDKDCMIAADITTSNSTLGCFHIQSYLKLDGSQSLWKWYSICNGMAQSGNYSNVLDALSYLIVEDKASQLNLQNVLFPYFIILL